ncbi:LPXTG cell wall anchor domain-containing protein [Corynebacterium tuberculostearicum]|uniref:LPXTG cell wall anchor domain-containing protein n=1 Tax=Corynebacterium tuberculostearicum TaxID=38304 RepID=UPI0038D0E5F0
MKKHYSLPTSVLAVALCAGLATPLATADERVISGNDRDVNASTVDSSRSIDVTFRKIPLNPYDDRDPNALPDGGVEGLTFTLSKVKGIDVKTEDGRDAAKKMTVKKAREAGLDKVAFENTDSEGKALFTGLHPGLYLVEESAPDSEHDYRLSEPRLIILPLGNPTGTEFEYDSVAVMKGRPSTPPTPPTVPPTEPDTPGETTTPKRPPRENTPPGERTTHPDRPGSTAERDVEVLGQEPPEGGSGTGSRSHNSGVLASTGASVLGLIGFGAVLIIAGLWLSRRKKGES